MTDIVEQIDAWTNTRYASVSRKLFGYCELMRKTASNTEQLMPVTIPGRKQVSLDDRYDLITWVRLPGTIQPRKDIDGNDWGFGLDDAPAQRATLRLIVAHKVTLEENFIINFIQNFPSELESNGYEIISVDRPGISVDADHESVYRAELSDTVYEKHRFTWNIYALSINIEYVTCEEV
jgi:hypothetical protein